MPMFWRALVTGVLFAMAPQPSLQIHNDCYTVTWNPITARFTIATRRGQMFVREGKLMAPQGVARAVAIADEMWGAGQAIEVTHPEGSKSTIILFAHSPFILFRFTLHNDSEVTQSVRQIKPLSVLIDCEAPPDALKALGTGGLALLSEQPMGSYMWLAVAKPQSCSGVVAGWITTDRGSGVVLASRTNDLVRLDAQIDYGNLLLLPHTDTPLETFVLGYFSDARLGLEMWADIVAKVYAIRLPPQPVGYCTWYHAGASNENDLKRLAAFAAQHLKPYGFSVIQIDDGWQDGVRKDGPRRNFTRHRPDGPYPSGMKAIADYIRHLGLTPGLWFMPFAGTRGDPAFKDEWFVKRPNGEPYEVRWGGACLDMTHPEVRDYVRRLVHQIVHEWGYRYLKMDGLWMGTATPLMYVNDAYRDDGMGDAVFYDRTKTNMEVFRNALKLVREAAGHDAFLLGCCAPQNMRSYGGAFGLVDAMRIGPDTSPRLDRLFRGPLFGSRHYHLHRRIWYNDPDVLFVGPRVAFAHAQLLCSWVAVTGQLNISSDPYPDLPPERLDLLKRTIPSHTLPARPVDLFEVEPPRFWVVQDERHLPVRVVVGAFNWDKTPLRTRIPLQRLGLSEAQSYAAFEFWTNRLIVPIKGYLVVDLAPAIVQGPDGQLQASSDPCCAVFSIRPLDDHPQLLSTSRHITQGLVDVLQETWDASRHALQGESLVVGNDPYEMRFLLYTSQGEWRYTGVRLSPADEAAGVKIVSVRTEPGLVRLVLVSPETRRVQWCVHFAPPLR